MKLHDFFQTHNALKSGDIILDVRNPDEYAQGHIAKALNIPLPQLLERKSELKNFQQIFIHCKRGGRAKTAMGLLESEGFSNLICIDDAGMDLWIESGYPVER